MKNTVRFLLPSLFVLGLALVQCGGSDDTVVAPPVTAGGGGASGGGLGGLAGVTPNQGGAPNVGGGAQGGAPNVGGGAQGGAPNVGGGAGTPAQGGTAGAPPDAGKGGDASPPVDSGACPAQRPNNGSTCVDSGQTCNYPAGGGTGARSCDCVTVAGQSVWACVTVTVDAGPQCPAIRPTSGNACPDTSLMCNYPAGGGAGARTCDCATVGNQDVWVCVATPVDAGPATCPPAANRPATGDSCTNTALVCPYPAAGGPGSQPRTCACTALLNVDQWVCVNTPVDAGVTDAGNACPATAPTAGDGCTAVQTCTYGGATCRCRTQFGPGTDGGLAWQGFGCN